MTSRSPLVVVTGAGGIVGQRVVGSLVGRVRLRLVDSRRQGDPPPGAELLTADLNDDGAWAEAIRGADTVVHLAANSSPLQDARTAIVEVAGLSAGLADALAGSQVSHVILASSVHTVGRHYLAQRWPVHADDPSWPCCPYGAAKLYAEDVLALACADRGALLTVLRLGLVGWTPVDEMHRSTWTGDGDMSAVVRKIVLERLHGTFIVASNGARGRWDIETTERSLGVRFTNDPPELTGRTEVEVPERCLLIRCAHAEER